LKKIGNSSTKYAFFAFINRNVCSIGIATYKYNMDIPRSAALWKSEADSHGFPRGYTKNTILVPMQKVDGILCP
jgi:hypothetical protein